MGIRHSFVLAAGPHREGSERSGSLAPLVSRADTGWRRTRDTSLPHSAFGGANAPSARKATDPSLHILVPRVQTDFISQLTTDIIDAFARQNRLCVVHSDALSLLTSSLERSITAISLMEPIGSRLDGGNALSVGTVDGAAQDHLRIDTVKALSQFADHICLGRYQRVAVIRSGSTHDFRNPLLFELVGLAAERGLAVDCILADATERINNGHTLFVLASPKDADALGFCTDPMQSLADHHVVCAYPIGVGQSSSVLRPVIDTGELAANVVARVQFSD